MTRRSGFVSDPEGVNAPVLCIVNGCQFLLDITPILLFERTQERDFRFLRIVDRPYRALLEAKLLHLSGKSGRPLPA